MAFSPILASLSVCHLLNDLLQSLLPALYPMFKSVYALDFWQVGVITLVNQATASMLQPVVGLYADRRPHPDALPVGMAFTLVGLLVLGTTMSYVGLLAAAALVGIGSAIFHPESSRLARVASGGRYGFAQSLFQTGGNFGSALGPLLAAVVVLPRGQHSVVWFAVLALAAIVILLPVGRSLGIHTRQQADERARQTASHTPERQARILMRLLVLVFARYLYLSSMTSYYTFFLIERFGVSIERAQLHLFGFLGAVALGTFIGGPAGDRFGRRPVILISILGVLPFTLALPYVGLVWTTALSVVIGLTLASAFSAVLVFAQELVPGRVGFISGFFFGFSFAVAGAGAAALGALADRTSVEYVFRVCAFLPALGVLALTLPNVRSPHRA